MISREPRGPFSAADEDASMGFMLRDGLSGVRVARTRTERPNSKWRTMIHHFQPPSGNSIKAGK